MLARLDLIGQNAGHQRAGEMLWRRPAKEGPPATAERLEIGVEQPGWAGAATIARRIGGPTGAATSIRPPTGSDAAVLLHRRRGFGHDDHAALADGLLAWRRSAEGDTAR